MGQLVKGLGEERAEVTGTESLARPAGAERRAGREERGLERQGPEGAASAGGLGGEQGGEGISGTFQKNPLRCSERGSRWVGSKSLIAEGALTEQ